MLARRPASPPPVPSIAARFHKGLAIAIVGTVEALRRRGETFDTLALSGDCLEPGKAVLLVVEAEIDGENI